MANALYPKFKEQLLSGAVNMLTATVKCMLIKNGYTYSTSHQYVSDISTYDNGRSSALTGKTVTNGVFDADDVSLAATAAVETIGIVLYIDSGDDATSLLVAYIDSATGLPFTPAAGGQVNIVWDNGAYRIFAL